MTRSKSLLTFSVSKPTLSKYNDALRLFLRWCRSGDRDAFTYDELDRLLLIFFDSEFLKLPTRGNRQFCVNVRSAVLLYLPNAKSHLNASQRALVGWDRAVPSNQTPPMPLCVCMHLALDMARCGDFECSLIVLLCFFGYLRISECLNLLWEDITFPAPQQPGGVRLRQTKTGKNQSVLIHRPFIWDIFRRFQSRFQRGSASPFSLTRQQFSGKLHHHLVSLGLTGLGLTTHSMRHGGATYDFMQGVPVADIIEKGRWKSQLSASRYLQCGQSLLLSQHIPNNIFTHGNNLLLQPHTLSALFSQ